MLKATKNWRYQRKSLLRKEEENQSIKNPKTQDKKTKQKIQWKILENS